MPGLWHVGVLFAITACTVPVTVGTVTLAQPKRNGKPTMQIMYNVEYDPDEFQSRLILHKWCVLLTLRIGIERWKRRAAQKCWSLPEGAGYQARSSANGTPQYNKALLGYLSVKYSFGFGYHY